MSESLDLFCKLSGLTQDEAFDYFDEQIKKLNDDLKKQGIETKVNTEFIMKESIRAKEWKKAKKPCR